MIRSKNLLEVRSSNETFYKFLTNSPLRAFGLYEVVQKVKNCHFEFAAANEKSLFEMNEEIFPKGYLRYSSLRSSK